MSTTASLNDKTYDVESSKDSIIIVKSLADIPGGRTLDVTGFDEDYIGAGHLIAKNANGNFVPLPISEGEYIEDLTGLELVGVLKITVPIDKPFAPIVTMGQVNAAASPYTVTDALKALLPNINFIY